MKKVLIFVTRYLAYASNIVFAHECRTALLQKGIDAEICDIMREEDAEQILLSHAGKKYDAILDFNSVLPRVMAEKEHFIDMIDAPFFDYIVDHPLYHDPILKQPVKNLNVICIDRDHADYVRKYYPHIKRVSFLTVPVGLHSSLMPFERRRNTLLFTGSYYPPEKFEKIMNELPDDIKKLCESMAEILIAENGENIVCSPEEAFDRVLEDSGKTADELITQVTSEERYSDDITVYRTLLNKCFVADIYARAILRRKAVFKAADTDVSLLLCGNEWDISGLCDRKNVEWIKDVDYREVSGLISSCKAVMNVLPGFTNGIHDRVTMGMMTGTAVVTNSNKYIDEFFKEGEDYLNLSHITDDSDILESIAGHGFEMARNMFSREVFADGLVKALGIDIVV
ncbi:MAG: hypothetical protein K6A72_04025 [Lachnospiraceae bacterium]|nr:hypothetical protein [Lachnospiraceae bacterium]